MTDSEQKKAAKRFSEFWQGKGYEKGESQSFWLSLLRLNDTPFSAYHSRKSARLPASFPYNITALPRCPEFPLITPPLMLPLALPYNNTPEEQFNAAAADALFPEISPPVISTYAPSLLNDTPFSAYHSRQMTIECLFMLLSSNRWQIFHTD